MAYRLRMSNALPQSDDASAQPKTKRKRTSAERQRRDTNSRPCRWAGVTAKSREGRLIKEVRAELLGHVGGAPSATQRALVERCVMLSVHLARMDTKALAAGAMSDHASREYLAWSNTLTRTLRQLGLKGEAAKPSIDDLLANRAA